MERIFKIRKYTRRLWIGVVLIFLFIFIILGIKLNTWGLVGCIPMMFFTVYSQAKLRYVIKENGHLIIKSVFNRNVCLSEITQVIYTPHAHLYTVKIKYANSSMMIAPECPEEFLTLLKQLNPSIKIVDKTHQ